jgi:hypothetical protein
MLSSAPGELLDYVFVTYIETFFISMRFFVIY